MEDLANTPFLILGNKVDHPNAMPEDQLRHELELYQRSRIRQSVAPSGLEKEPTSISLG